MLIRLALAVAPASAVLALDLGVKRLVATAPLEVHQRSGAWTVAAAAAGIVVLALAVLPSRLCALSAGVVSGGVLGNAISAQMHSGGVPNPLVAGGYAFNVADVCVLAGVPVLVVALAQVSIRHRATIDRLIPPRRWERRLRERLRL